MMAKQQHTGKISHDLPVASRARFLQPRPAQPVHEASAQPTSPQQEQSGSGNQGFDLTQNPVCSTEDSPGSGPGQPLQAKLTIGAPGDKYEQEADRVADRVVQQLNSPSETSGERSPSSQAESVQRESIEEEEELQMQPDPLQRQELEEEELQMQPLLQRQPGNGAVTAQPELEQSVQQRKGKGQPLTDAIRQPMEQAFGGVDFGAVNVHTDAQADQLNQAIQAKAFTTGQDIFFRQGAYQPASQTGQKLIAHELTHVVQQEGAISQPTSNSAGKEQIQRVSVNSTKKNDWNNLVSGSAGSGVNGVIFATAADGSKVVVKGLPEPPQRVMLAQEMMQQVGIGTTDTNPVPAQSKLGEHILNKLDELGTTIQNNDIRTKVANWRGYQTLLLMAPANVKSLQEIFTQGPGLPTPNVGPVLGGSRALQTADINQHILYFRNLFNDPKLWQDFGKMFFVDQFLGNEDRFETLKIQNIFIDNAGQVIALDNDTMAADYISQITSIDAVTNPHNPSQNISNKTPDTYIQELIGGGWMYNNTALQERMMGSLDQISGKSAELNRKVSQKVSDLLNLLLNAVQNSTKNSDRAATTVLTNLLQNTGNCEVNMVQGAISARHMIENMFNTKVGKKSNQFQALFEAQNKKYKKGYKPKEDVMYNYLALAIRYRYLELRSLQDHPTALGIVQAEFRQQVADMARVAKTETQLDQQTFVTSDNLVKIT
jgi:hypothetical protein